LGLCFLGLCQLSDAKGRLHKNDAQLNDAAKAKLEQVLSGELAYVTMSQHMSTQVLSLDKTGSSGQGFDEIKADLPDNSQRLVVFNRGADGIFVMQWVPYSVTNLTRRMVFQLTTRADHFVSKYFGDKICGKVFYIKQKSDIGPSHKGFKSCA